jgi:hypothetical protein
MSKPEKRKEARDLRKQGYGIKTISHKIHVSSSTVSLWCRDIKLTKEQLIELDRRSHDPFYGKRKQNIENQKKKKLLKIEKYKNIGIKQIGSISNRDLFIAGVALYWAEGFKKDKRLGFANSDPEMIKMFLLWLKKCCNVPINSIRLRVGINISHKHRINEIEAYWSKITEIKKTQFQKPFFQKFIWKKEFPNPNKYFGVLRIRANKQLPLFRKINGWIEGLKINSKD